MNHDLKTHPRYWQAVKDGAKTFEVREDGRGFAEGDIDLFPLTIHGEQKEANK